MNSHSNNTLKPLKYTNDIEIFPDDAPFLENRCYFLNYKWMPNKQNFIGPATKKKNK